MKAMALSAAAAALIVSSFISPAYAGKGGPTPVPVLTINKFGHNDNKLFVGIHWNWGVRTGATAVIGYRWARINADDRVRGGLVDLTFPLSGAGFGAGEFHVKGLAGRRNLQGELGLGFAFQSKAFLLGGGVRAPNSTLGADYLVGKGWQPYVGVTSLGRPKGPTVITTTTLTCPAGWVVVDGNCVTDQGT